MMFMRIQCEPCDWIGCQNPCSQYIECLLQNWWCFCWHKIHCKVPAQSELQSKMFCGDFKFFNEFPSQSCLGIAQALTAGGGWWNRHGILTKFFDQFLVGCCVVPKALMSFSSTVTIYTESYDYFQRHTSLTCTFCIYPTANMFVKYMNELGMFCWLWMKLVDHICICFVAFVFANVLLGLHVESKLLYSNIIDNTTARRVCAVPWKFVGDFWGSLALRGG